MFIPPSGLFNPHINLYALFNKESIEVLFNGRINILEDKSKMLTVGINFGQVLLLALLYFILVTVLLREDSLYKHQKEYTLEHFDLKPNRIVLFIFCILSD